MKNIETLASQRDMAKNGAQNQGLPAGRGPRRREPVYEPRSNVVKSVIPAGPGMRRAFVKNAKIRRRIVWKSTWIPESWYYTPCLRR